MTTVPKRRPPRPHSSRWARSPRRQCADHHFDTDQLQRDVRHRRDNAGHGDRQRQHAAAIASRDEVGRCHVTLTFGDAPQFREHDEREWIDQDRVRQREETRCARTEHQRRHGDEGVSGVQIAAQQEPRDDGAEAPAAEAPLFQMGEVALAPVSRDKAENGDADKKQDKDECCGGVHYRAPPCELPVERVLVLKYTSAVMIALINTHSSWYQ